MIEVDDLAIDRILGIEDHGPVVPCSVCDKWQRLASEIWHIKARSRYLNKVAQQVFSSWFIGKPMGFTLEEHPEAHRIPHLNGQIAVIARQHMPCERCGIMIGPEHHERTRYRVKGLGVCGDCATWMAREDEKEGK